MDLKAYSFVLDQPWMALKMKSAIASEVANYNNVVPSGCEAFILVILADKARFCLTQSDRERLIEKLEERYTNIVAVRFALFEGNPADTPVEVLQTLLEDEARKWVESVTGESANDLEVDPSSRKAYRGQPKPLYDGVPVKVKTPLFNFGRDTDEEELIETLTEAARDLEMECVNPYDTVILTVYLPRVAYERITKPNVDKILQDITNTHEHIAQSRLVLTDDMLSAEELMARAQDMDNWLQSMVKDHKPEDTTAPSSATLN